MRISVFFGDSELSASIAELSNIVELLTLAFGDFSCIALSLALALFFANAAFNLDPFTFAPFLFVTLASPGLVARLPIGVFWTETE